VPLYKACSMAQIFPTVSMAIRKSGGDMILYLQYILRAVQITSVGWEGGSGAERPKETLILKFKAMGMQYVRQNPDGSASSMGLIWYWNSTAQGSSTLTVDGITTPPPSPPFLPPTQTYLRR